MKRRHKKKEKRKERKDFVTSAHIIPSAAVLPLALPGEKRTEEGRDRRAALADRS